MNLLRITLPLALAGSALAQGPLPPPPTPPENPTTAEKAVLGKILFWDEQLSSDGSMACGTCHMPATGGGDPRLVGAATHPGGDGVAGTPDDVFGSPGVARANAFGHFVDDPTFGFGTQATHRNAPSMIAAAYFPELFWDGRASGTFRDPETGAVVIAGGGALESQSLAPILNDVEMADEGRGWDDVTARLAGATPLALATGLPADVAAALTVDPTYPALFQRAFGTPDVTPVRIAFALASYQRTLVPDQSKFDRVMRGQAQFTQAEQRGRGAFNSPGSRCNACHAGSLFSDRGFHNLGLRPTTEDQGRRDVTGLFADRGRFKTPSLRNVELRERFFHTGAPNIDDLQQLLGFYDADGGPFADNKDPILAGLNVPPQVRPDLIAFLRTLTDPRVAAETFPFDRPTLWSERARPNPEPLGTGGVFGSGLVTPQVTAAAPAHSSNDGFRIGVHGGLGGAWAALHVRVRNLPAGGPVDVLRPALPRPLVLEGSGPGNGHATWAEPGAVAPALVGMVYDAQWLIRDPGAPGGLARTEVVRVTVE